MATRRLDGAAFDLVFAHLAYQKPDLSHLEEPESAGIYPKGFNGIGSKGAKGEQVRAAEPRGPLDLRTVEEKKSVTTMVDVVEKRLRAARVAGINSM
ncbi:hypothetical protein D910_03398 [Dendroctonus ponderosae]|uniref:Uncharacterized protein n=1 Tax=Dendroctonus ponderosae TaxID=77166 RepID=U4TWM5_DENPD|nr:hypothetical protein D910_03398 [Dendroctonus ponderosae]